MRTSQTKNTALIGIIAVVILAAAIGGTIVFSPKKTDNTSESPTLDSTQTSQPANTSTGSSTGEYKSGTYTATGKYDTPESQESIEVTITISGDKVSDANIVTKAVARESREYQADFASGYKNLVIGKDVSSLRLSKVSGSSLTSRGFNDALDQIRSQAKV